MNELHLFAGAGGGILGGMLCGHRCVCAVEISDYCRRVLLQRQRDGILPWFPIWDNVTTFSGRDWRGRVDVVCGGFPCTDISQIKQDAAGIEGDESGLWREMARITDEVRPNYVWIENSPMLIQRGLGRVLCDLYRLGYDARWGVLGARHAGACHLRDRLWILGYPQQPRLERHAGNVEDAERWPDKSRSDFPTSVRLAGWKRVVHTADCDHDVDGDYYQCPNCGVEYGECECPGPTMDDELDYQIRDGISYARPRNWWTTERGVQRMAHGVAHRVDRLEAIGNGQVPAVVALAWRILGKGIVNADKTGA